MTSQVRYSIVDKIAAGGVAGELRTISFRTSQMLPPFRAVRQRVRAVDGTAYTNLDRVDDFWDVTTAIITSTVTQAQFSEFFASVVGGATFEWDAEAAGFINVQMESADWRPVRRDVLTEFRYRWRMLEL